MGTWFSRTNSARAVGDEKFVGEHAPSAVGCRQQLLRNNSLQRIGKLHHNLPLRTAFEHTDDAFERVRDIGECIVASTRCPVLPPSAQSRSLQSRAFRRRQHIRILPQHMHQCAIERTHVVSTPVHDNGTLVLVTNSIGSSMVTTLQRRFVVDEVNEVIQRGRLACAVGPVMRRGHWAARQFIEAFGQTQSLSVAMRSPQKRKLISGWPLRR